MHYANTLDQFVNGMHDIQGIGHPYIIYFIICKPIVIWAEKFLYLCGDESKLVVSL